MKKLEAFRKDFKDKVTGYLDWGLEGISTTSLIKSKEQDQSSDVLKRLVAT